ncbi:MAG: hypothetical protein ACK43M_14405 [Allorhizobium sp.]
MTDAIHPKPAAGGSYIRDKDGSIRLAAGRAPATEAASAATEAQANQTGAQPKKRK